MRIGIIGLGAMGLPIALNLARAGQEVRGYDVSEEQRNQFAAQGGVAVSQIRSAAEEAEVILLSLPNAAVVESVMLDEDGVLCCARPGSCVVDLSSVGPGTSRSLYEKAKSRRIQYADAPVSGGVGGASAGTLTVMFGGDEEAWRKARPVLEIIGKKLFYVGKIGAGDAVKLINNLMLGCNMAAIVEALNLGIQLGLSLETIRDIVGSSSGNSYAFAAKMDTFIIPGQFEGGFATDLQYKDLKLAQEAGQDMQVPLPMTAAAAQVFEASRAMGNGRKDMSSAVMLWKKKKEDTKDE